MTATHQDRWIKLYDAAERTKWGRSKASAGRLVRRLRRIERTNQVVLLQQDGPKSAILVDWDAAEPYLVRRRSTAEQWEAIAEDLERRVAGIVDRRNETTVARDIASLDQRLADVENRRLSVIEQREQQMMEILKKLTSAMANLARK